MSTIVKQLEDFLEYMQDEGDATVGDQKVWSKLCKEAIDFCQHDESTLKQVNKVQKLIQQITGCMNA